MRLSLRTLLAFEDNVFDMEQHRQLERTIPMHEPATRALSRIRDVIRDPRLGVPGIINRHEELDPNLVAEYLDHQMSPEYLEQFEGYCFSDDRYLAEVASVHQIVSNTLGEPARTNRDCRLRCYQLYSERKEARRTDPPLISERVESWSEVVRLETAATNGSEEHQSNFGSILKYPEPDSPPPKPEKSAAHPKENRRKFQGIVFLLLAALLLGLLLIGWTRYRKERSDRRFDRKESHTVLPDSPKQFPPKSLPKQPAFAYAVPTAPKSEPKPAPPPPAEPEKKPEPKATPPAETKKKPEPTPAPPAKPKKKPEPASTPPAETTKKSEPEPKQEKIAVDPFLQAALVTPPVPTVVSDLKVPPAPTSEDPWKSVRMSPAPVLEPISKAETISASLPAEPSFNPLREENPVSVASTFALVQEKNVEERKPPTSIEAPRAASWPIPIPVLQTDIPKADSAPFRKTTEPFREQPEISFQGVVAKNVLNQDADQTPPTDFPKSFPKPAHRLEYHSPESSERETATTSIADADGSSPHRQASLIIPMGGLMEEKPQPLKPGNPLQAPNLRCCVKESTEPCVVFTAKSAESPWTMETKELNLHSNQYLLTATPFRADLELGSYQVEMIGDSKLCILPPDVHGRPGLFLDYGRLVLRLREGESGKAVQPLRIQTEKTEGLVSIDGPRSLVFIDTFAEIIETPDNVRESATLGAPVRTDAILGLLPDPAESVSWKSADRVNPLITRREISVLLAEGRSDEGSIRNHPNWLRRLSLSPECRELEAACRRAFEKHPTNCEAALQMLIRDPSPSVRSYGFRLWGDLGRFDIPLAQMSQLDETEESLRKILVAYFREVMKRDAETVQRLADAIDAARR